ncbi:MULTISPECIES: HEAT repeat domain-containing protein [unclassified Clostridium]|uniref:HEAT repeat domain-containing protein n=1 Tax=unclassified Clostridium TaxID=2614128 RepID=UPI000297F56E|nr:MULTISPECIES: HEAT repeat domain-containing protein [unclassified Clostridium]EKQ58296.1 MAG: HEAT repeat protein [Clostridium sp. Maddingley MBC34-26]
MEQYVYLSIIFFSLITFFLYIYIVFEKTVETYRNKRRKKYYKKLVPYVDFIVNEIIEGKDLELFATKNLKILCKNKEKREIIEERLIHYFEEYKGEFLPKLIELCEYTKIVKYEIQNLKDKNSFKKALAAKRLGEFREWKSAGALLNELRTRNSDVQYNILLALAKIGDEDYFIKAFETIDSAVILSERSLIEIVDSFEGNKHKINKYMINQDNSFIAGVFIKSAGNHKDISLSKDISQYLFNENKELRIASIKAIGSIGDETYLEDIIKLLEDNEWEVRAIAARALGNFTDSRILTPLTKALSDNEWYVRYNAATSILDHKDGINVISGVLRGEDKFAKDIIISAIENSSNGAHLYENSQNPDKVELALLIKEYTDDKNKEIAT